jgi:hypothetical protein
VSGGATADWVLGCTNRHGSCTGTTASARRTPRRPPGATTTTRNDGRRRSTAEELRRSGHGEDVHGVVSKRYRRLPYLAAKARRRLLGDGRRRELGSTAAARQGWRRRWVIRVSATGAKPRGWQRLYRVEALGVRTHGPGARRRGCRSEFASGATPTRSRVRAAARQGRDDMRGPHVSGSSGVHTQGRRLAGRASQRSGWAGELG